MLPAGKLLTWQLLYLFASHASAINNFAQRYHYDVEDPPADHLFSPRRKNSRQRRRKAIRFARDRRDRHANQKRVSPLTPFSLQEENPSSSSSLERSCAQFIADSLTRDGASRES